MSFLKSIFGGENGVIGQVSKVVDKFVTTSGEKEELKQQIVKVLQDQENIIAAEITKRHESDMNSDSWLSKNIRPMVLIFILVMYSVFSLIDGRVMEINDSYVQLLGDWGMMIMSFYFGSRGIEKILQTVGKYQIGRKS